MNELTDQKFWEAYWEKQEYPKLRSVFFDDLITKFGLRKDAKLLEIGGFPGQFGAYLKRKYGWDITILDYYLEPNIINQVEDVNQIERGSIKYIKTDVLNSPGDERYDLVCSFGLIEHFYETKKIIQSHLKYLVKNGSLFITIPNFTGLNGIFQKVFDRENYNKHNIGCMNVRYLEDIMKQFDLKSFEVEYHGKPTVWLEKDAKISKFGSLLVNRLLIPLLSFLPFRKNRFFSPYIYIYAKK
jgi:2-polyprenyl-3-methyl-5-hydroxy-6-metoxy-1,4-benzoquinol methylase